MLPLDAIRLTGFENWTDFGGSTSRDVSVIMENEWNLGEEWLGFPSTHWRFWWSKELNVVEVDFFFKFIKNS